MSDAAPRRPRRKKPSSPPPAATVGDEHAPTLEATARTVSRPASTRKTSAATGGIDKYRLSDELGRGGLAVVRLATDTTLRRELAVKFLQRADKQKQVDSFIEEAQITSQLQHPNIVPVYELGHDPAGRPYLAMKRIVGRTFGKVIADAHRRSANSGGIGRSAELRRLLEVFLKICDGVAYAHSCGIIHRDLKPENVMVGEFGEVLVVDWGLARPIGTTIDGPDADGPEGRAPVTSDRRAGGEMITMEGSIQGTPAYMAPEQARGRTTLDAACDIHALGGILYKALTTQTPFAGRNVTEVLQLVVEHDLPTMRQRAPAAGIPPALDAIVMKAMARQPRQRFRSANELKEEIERFLDDEPVQCARYGVGERASRWLRRHPTLAMSTALLLVAGLAVVALLGQLSASESARIASDSAREASESAREASEVNRELAQQIADRKSEQLVATRLQRELAESRAATEAQRAAAEKERADAEALRAELEAQRADAAEQHAESLGDEISALLDRRSQQDIDEFQRRWSDARASGLSQAAFAAQLRPEEAAAYLKAYDALFRVYDQIRADPAFGHYANRAFIHTVLGNNAEAIDDYNEALRLAPDVPEAALMLHNRGTAKSANNDPRGAIRDYDAALRKEPRQVISLVNRGMAKRRLGDPDAAIADYDRALEIDPRSAIALDARGNAKGDKGDYAAALRDYDRALEIDPRYCEAWYDRGTTKYFMEDFAGAIRDFDGALRIDPAHTASLGNRAAARHGLGDVDGALADMDALLRLTPDDWEAWRNRAAMLADHDPAESLRSLQQAYRLCPDADTRTALASAIRSRGGQVPD